jgi:CubicO group peptidase (beta-lactamase class C family)
MFHVTNRIRSHAWVTTCAVLVLLSWPVPAATPRAKPEDVGLSSERLHRIGETIQRHIQAGQIASAVTLVARRGRVAHLESFGQLDIESKHPAATDSLFRIASMSKPVTGVAILMLLEDGKVRLNDPVSRFIPEFKSLQVSAGGAAPVPAKRDMTIGDLLTHTSGLVSGPANAEIAKILPGMALLPDTTRPQESLERYLPRIAAFPLSFQPGERYSYSPLAAFDVLGRVVEVASGQTFDRFLKDRLFDPLGMTNTSFTNWREQQARLALIYRRTPGGPERFANQNQLVSDVYFSGGAGLISTAEDYFQFAQMLLDRGRANGRVLLSPTTVDLMIAPHAPDTLPGSTRGGDFGLSVQVMRDPLALGQRVSSGSFGWGGAYGTNFWIDPKEKLVGVLMIQMQGGSAETRRDFQSAVMQAIVESP